MYRLYFLILILTPLISSCTKEVEGNNPNCPGFNTCFHLDGRQYAGKATWQKSIQGRYKMFFENGTAGGAFWETVSIDIHGTTPGTYKVVSSGTTVAGDARFEVMRADGPLTKVYNGYKGMVVMTSTSDGEWTGTFQIDATKDQGATHSTMGGSFFEVLEK